MIGSQARSGKVDLKKIRAVIGICELAEEIYMRQEFYGERVSWESLDDLLHACEEGNGILDAAKKFVNSAETMKNLNLGELAKLNYLKEHYLGEYLGD